MRCIQLLAVSCQKVSMVIQAQYLRYRLHILIQVHKLTGGCAPTQDIGQSSFCMKMVPRNFWSWWFDCICSHCGSGYLWLMISCIQWSDNFSSNSSSGCLLSDPSVPPSLLSDCSTSLSTILRMKLSSSFLVLPGSSLSQKSGSTRRLSSKNHQFIDFVRCNDHQVVCIWETVTISASAHKKGRELFRIYL